MQYYFILGKNPLLSKAEIQAVLEKDEVRRMKSEVKGKIYFIETEKSLDVDWLNSRLGGTVKIGKVLATLSDLDEFQDTFFKFVEFEQSKFYFGFSFYSLSPKMNIPAIQKKMNAVAMEIKSILRDEKKISSRYVISKEPELSSVIVAKNKLLKNGAEFCFFIEQGKILMGQTLAVQEFEAFGARDFTRPGRDNVSGMLPPKLARIMINFAQVKEDAVILDPFCGSGTILQEAIVLGYKNLIGTDNSDKAVEDTKRNLEWFLNAEPRSGFPLRGKGRSSKYEVFKLDVKELSNKFKPNSINTIITEPYLGPAIKGNEGPEQIRKTVKELEILYLIAFKQFAEVLVKGGKVVMVFPVFHLKNIIYTINLLNQIEKLGFKKLNPEELEYFREKQFVRRSIEIFEKIK